MSAPGERGLGKTVPAGIGRSVNYGPVDKRLRYTTREGLGHVDQPSKLRQTERTGEHLNIGFDWMEDVSATIKPPKYNWDESRREEYTKSQRVESAWLDLGSTQRPSDSADPDRQMYSSQLGKSNMYNTKHPDSSFADGEDSDVHVVKFGVERPDGRRMDDVRPPSRETVGDRKLGRQQWVSLAANKEEMGHWHEMFTQMRTKNTPAYWMSSEENAFSAKTYTSYNSDTSSSTGTSYRKSPSEKTTSRRLQYGIIIGAVAVILLIAVLVPTLVLVLPDNKDATPALESYEMEASVQNRNYSPAMADNTSSEFLGFATEFCGQVDAKMAANQDISSDYQGCNVKSMSNGSIIVNFILVISHKGRKAHDKEDVRNIIVSGAEDLQSSSVTLGVLVLLTSSVKVTVSTTVTEIQTPIRKSVNFNETCIRNGREKCITSMSICYNGRCACDSNRRFNKPNDSCVEYTCTEIPVIANGQASKETYGSNEHVIVTCNQGFKLIGTNNITCSTSNKWENVPSCTAITCATYVLPDFAMALPTQANRTKFNETIEIQCNNGYELQGTNEVRCQANGSWSEVAGCTPVTCSDPAPISQGEYLGLSNKYTFKDTLTAKCNNGYTLLGNDSVVTCQANKTWSMNVTCEKVVCSDPPMPDNGDVSNRLSENFTFGDNVSISCREGYVVDGPKTITCLANGTWSGTLACASIICSDPVEITNGGYTSNPNVYTYNVSLTANCSEGYEILGDPMTVCQANGTWSKNITCEKVECPSFETPGNGTLDIEANVKQFYQDNVTVACNQGFKPFGPDTSTCQSNGTWSTNLTCIPFSCPDLQGLENGQYMPAFTNGTVQAICHNGYVLNGADLVACQENDTWTDVPTCERIVCPELTLPEKGQLDVNSTSNLLYMDNVTLSCDEGFFVDGPETITCLANGTWSGTLTCASINCSVPAEITNGGYTSNPNVYTYNVSLTANCSAGYEILGDPMTVCQANGTWSKNITCDKVECPMIEIPDHGIIDVNSNDTHFFMDSARLECETGYEINGSSTVECTSNGTWNGSFGCVLVVCPDIGPLSNGGYINYTAVSSYNQNVTAFCYDGYFLSGPENVTCTANNSWTETPVCNPVVCPDLVLPDNSLNESHQLSGLVYNTTIKLLCKPGYNVTGTEYTVCQQNGSWSSIGSCAPIACEQFTYPNNSESHTNGTSGMLLYNETVNISCSAGYILIGKSPVSCYENGTWPIVECKPTLCNELDLQQINATRVYINESAIQILCLDGFTLNGSSFIYCTEGAWTEAPECLIVDCSYLELSPNLIIVNENYTTTYGSVVFLECMEGYKLNESFNRETCTNNSTWTNNTSCIIEDCGTFVYPEFSRIPSDVNTTYGSRISIECIDGYTLEGNSSVYCEHGEVWSGSPTCVEVVCDPLKVDNGFMSPLQANYTVNSSVAIQCNTRFRLSGPENGTCKSDGTWPVFGECFPIPAPNFTLTYMIVEGQDGWADRLSSCTADLSDTPKHQVGVEVKVGGDFSDPFGSSYNGDLDVEVFSDNTTEGNDGLLKFYFKNVSLSSNGSQIRCVIRDTDGEVVAVSLPQYVYVLPASFCDDKSVMSRHPHPHSCSSFVVCEPRVTVSACPSGLCFDANNPNTCQACATADCTNPSEPVDPDSAYITVDGEVKGGSVGSDVMIQVQLHNIDKVTDLSVIRKGGGATFNLHATDGISSSTLLNEQNGEYAEISVNISSNVTELIIEFPSITCKVDGTFTVIVNNLTAQTFRLQVITTSSSEPVLDVPGTLVLGQATTILCQGQLARAGPLTPAGTLVLQVNYTLNGTFVEYGTDTKLTLTEDNCTLHGTLNLDFFLTSVWNNSVIKCALKNTIDDSTLYSEPKEIVLSQSNMQFEISYDSEYIGGTVNMSCTVENAAGLTSIAILYGDSRTSVADTANSGSPDAGITILNSSFVSESGGALFIEANPTTCDSIGNYFCTTGSQTTMETLTLKRKPEKPVLTLSHDIIENKDTLADRVFSCEGIVGLPGGILDAEINTGGEFVSVIEDSARSIVTKNDTGNCSSPARLEFGLKNITMSMHGSVLRCIVKSVNGEFDTVYTDGEYIQVVPATYCSDNDGTGLIAHPYTCNTYVSCGSDMSTSGVARCPEGLCFKASMRHCDHCDTAGCSITTPAPPGTPVMTCNPSEASTPFGSTAFTFSCTVTNFDFLAANINISNEEGTGVLSLVAPVEGSEPVTERYISDQGYSMQLNVTETYLIVTFNTVKCMHQTTWTVAASNGDGKEVSSSIPLTVMTEAMVPVLTANEFILNSEVTLTCKAELGNPNEDKTLVLVSRRSSTDNFIAISSVAASDLLNKTTCSSTASLSYSFTVGEEVNNTEYRCDVESAGTKVHVSDIVTAELRGPVISISIPAQTQLGSPLVITCSLDPNSNFSSMELYKESDPDTPIARNDSLSGIDRSLTFSKPTAECADEGSYYCKVYGSSTTILSKGQVSVTRNASVPDLTMPRPIFADIGTYTLTCSASIGYPYVAQVLKVEIQSLAGTYEEFNIGTIMDSSPKIGDCDVTATVSYQQIRFPESVNNTMVRCAVYGDDNATMPLTNTSEKRIQILEGSCATLNTQNLPDAYFVYPFDCHSYLRCYTGGFGVQACAANLCPIIENSTSINCGDCSPPCP